MSTPIGDYALLADLHTGPLVSKHGSIDWLCLPRFDSDSVFAAILGAPEHGRWLMAPENGTLIERHYEPDTFILRSNWETPTGTAEIIEFMPIADHRADILRIARCTSGEVSITHELLLRPGYAESLPWVRRAHEKDAATSHLRAVAGPDSYALYGPALTDAGRRHCGNFPLAAGEEAVWDLAWAHSYRKTPAPVDVDDALARTRQYWQKWAEHTPVSGPWADAVSRSLLVLRALTHIDTGGIVAAPTTSLPEDPGGERNWDYRFCWLRDSALTLEALLLHGGTKVAHHWRNWLLRAVAGDPEDVQIMYGIAGERRLTERTLDHLPGYLDSRPVRIGNGAVDQFQADVIGEVIIALAKLRGAGVTEDTFSWALQKALIDQAMNCRDRKDQGLWEMRGAAHYFTHSRVMIWAALDRGIRAVREAGLSGAADEWEQARDSLREEILTHGVDPKTGAFTQHYDTDEVDASLLQIPQTGFVSYQDPRMLATVARIENDLMHDGLLLRYRTIGTDGLTGDEYPFLACSFWLVEQYACSDREDDANALMTRLVGLSNDLGLLAEEYDPRENRQMGNFPQAFSHLALVRAADALAAPDSHTHSERSSA